MISTRAFVIFDYLTRFGNAIRLTPWTWNTKTRRLSGLSRKWSRQYIYVVLACISGQIWMITYCALTILLFDVPVYQIAVGGCGMAMLALTAIESIAFLTGKSQLILWLNGIFRLNELQMTQFKLKEYPRDEVSTMLTLLIGTTTTITALTGPAIIIILQLDWEIMWLVPYFPLPWPEAWATLFLTFNWIVVYLTHLNGIVPLYLAIHVFITGMQKNVCDTKNPSAGAKHKARHLYRVQYILYRAAEDILYYGLPPIIATGVFLIIAVLYTLIAMYSVLDIWLIFTMILFIVVALAFAYIASNDFNKMTRASLDYYNSYKSMDEKMTKFDKAYYRSFRPMVWHIGNFFEINKDFFTEVMEFIIENVADLLVAYEY